MTFKFPSLREIVIGFIAAFFGLQIVSLVISNLFPSVGLFKGGPIILVFLLGIAIISLFILGIRYDQLKTKENLIFIILIFGLLIAAYVYLPKYLPQIFVINPGISEAIKSTVYSIVGSG